MRKITKELSVYLVDDDADDRLIFTEAISEVAEHCSLSIFTDGQQIIDFLTKPDVRLELPDIIFLDINMPLINGLETLEYIRKKLMLNSVPIAMYSTSQLNSNISQALEVGANLYMTKPSSFKDLTALLKKALSAVIQHDNTFDYRTFVMSI